jgi:hypothetical protein
MAKNAALLMTGIATLLMAENAAFLIDRSQQFTSYIARTFQGT